MLEPLSNEFELITAMSYHPETGFHLLPLHLDRLHTAHQAIAEEMPQSWCARRLCPTSEMMVAQLENAVLGGKGHQRVSGQVIISQQYDSRRTEHMS